MAIPHRLVSSSSVQLRECLDLHHGGPGLALPQPGHHVHALLLVLGEGDVVPVNEVWTYYRHLPRLRCLDGQSL